jgi:hypothetical protein
MKIASLASVAAAASLLATAGPAQAQVPVYVDGSRLHENAFVVPEAGRAVVPMRALFESIGARVAWDPAERAAYAWTADGRGVRIPVGQSTAQILEMTEDPRPGDWGRVVESRPLDVIPLIQDGRTFIPLRFASEALQADVRYAAAEPAIHIDTERVAGFREVIPPQILEPRLQNLDARLHTRDTQFSLAQETSVPLRLTVENTGTMPLTVPFASGQMYDFEVRRNGELVWNWAHDKAFTQALQQRQVPAGEEMEFAESWDFRNNDGERVPPGEYTVRGVLTAQADSARVSDEVRITITD